MSQTKPGLRSTASPDQARVAVAQIGCHLGDPDGNSLAIENALADAASQGASLCVFPECSLTGYMFADREEVQEAAIALRSSPVTRLAHACERLDAYCIVGFLEERGGRVHNAAALIGPEGIVGVHRKRHLPFLGADRF